MSPALTWCRAQRGLYFLMIMPTQPPRAGAQNGWLVSMGSGQGRHWFQCAASGSVIPRALVRLAASAGCQNRETLAQKRGGDVYCGWRRLENSDESREHVDHAFPNMNCRVDAGNSCLFT